MAYAPDEVEAELGKAARDMSTEMELSNCSYELIFCPLANVQMRVVVDPLPEMDAPLAGNIIYDHSLLEPIHMVMESIADGIVHVHLPVSPF